MCASVRCIVVSASALVAALAGSGVRASEDVAVIGTDGRPGGQAGSHVGSSTELSRLDVPHLGGRELPGSRTDATAVTLQRWATRGGAGVGLGVGGVTLVERPTSLAPGRFSDNGGAVTSASGTMLVFGLRYRPTSDSSIYADTTHLSGLGLAGDDRVVSKVGVEFKAAQSNWKIDYGGLGLRFAGDTRMTVKLRRSGVSIGMRRSF